MTAYVEHRIPTIQFDTLDVSATFVTPVAYISFILSGLSEIRAVPQTRYLQRRYRRDSKANL